MYNDEELFLLRSKLEKWNAKYAKDLNYDEYCGFPIDVYQDLHNFDLYVDKKDEDEFVVV